MIKNYLLYFFMLALGLSNAQQYKPGYYIDNSSNKITGFIKSQKSNETPDKIYFKSNLNSDEQMISSDAIEGFGIDNEYQYTKFYIEIDLSSDKVGKLSKVRKANFERKRLLMRLILDGKASLYYYEKGGLKKYFYKIDDGQLKQLLYKKYLDYQNNIKENNYFKQQLYNSLRECSAITEPQVKGVDYTQNDLIRILDAYNSCNNSTSIVNRKKALPSKFRLSVGAGVSFFSADLINNNPNLSVDFGGTALARVSAEIEMLLPLEDYRFSFFTGFIKNANYEETKTIPTSSSVNPTQDATFVYEAFEIPIGARYYIPLNDDLRLSLHFGYAIEFMTAVGLDYSVSLSIAESDGGSGHMFTGLGLQYKNFNLESRININQQSIKAEVPTLEDSKINNFAIVFSYNLL